jgi:hypothetical protein
LEPGLPSSDALSEPTAAASVYLDLIRNNLGKFARSALGPGLGGAADY